MDTNNGIPNQGDWRGQLHPLLRQKVVNRITESLKKHSLVSGQEELHELQNIVQRFEDKNFTAATSEGTMVTDILSSLDKLTMETEFQDTMANTITSSLDIKTESQGPIVNNITSSLDMEIESLVTMANNIYSSLDMETESRSQGTMANTIYSSLDMETESRSQGTMANTISSNQVGPINEPPDRANGRQKRRRKQGDWRGKLQSGMRERAVDNLLDPLKIVLPFPGQEGLHQLRKHAQRFEKRIFTAATSESDYARKIFLESLTIETKFQGTLANNMTWNQNFPSNKPLDPGRLNQGDWRSTLQPGARERNVNRTMDAIKEQLPIVSGQEGSDEFSKIVQSFEEGIFTAATSKADYVRQIYLKSLALKTQCQDTEMNIIAFKLTQLMK